MIAVAVGRWCDVEGSVTRKRYLRTRARRKNMESWPMTRPCVKVGCSDNRYPILVVVVYHIT
jgi:hypothetical protein